MAHDIGELFALRERERFAMHSRYLNEQMVRVLQAIGYDVGFCRGEGQYLYDREGNRYLDLLSGFGVFAIGRNHRVLREALKSVLDKRSPQPRSDGRVDPCGHSRRAIAGGGALSRQSIFSKFGIESGRGGD
jgi:4-aminobutyrate aminotransferase-like enzyme